MMTTDMHHTIAEVRRFNRFYTRQIGLLNEHLLRSPYSLTEARLLYEIAHHERTTAAALSKELGLDPGYLSRILARFQSRGLIEKQASQTDRRQAVVSLSQAGQQAFSALNSGSNDEVASLLSGLELNERERLVQAMHQIELLLGGQPESRVPNILRPPQPGDFGWVIQRHGSLYAQEYGWDEHFEALVADIAAKFIQNFDPKRERCWIAERDGQPVGSVFLVKLDDEVAKLRLLLVEPEARGLGIGSRLVEQCIRFARQVGYSKITLWTNSILLAARQIYRNFGFRLVSEEPYHDFGHDLVSETWELDL